MPCAPGRVNTVILCTLIKVNFLKYTFVTDVVIVEEAVFYKCKSSLFVCHVHNVIIEQLFLTEHKTVAVMLRQKRRLFRLPQNS
jgi:hypothetical protein